MEGCMRKRRMVSSLHEPNKLLRAVFAQKYANYLVPALIKINKKICSEKEDDCELEKIVRFEVDMALVLSADGFAWSRALKHKLQRDVCLGKFHNSSNHHLSLFDILTYSQNSLCIIEEKSDYSLPLPPVQNALVSAEYSQNPNSKPKTEKSKRPKRLHLLRRAKKDAAKKSEEEHISRRLMNLRMLLPGGKEMAVDELLSEVGSYLVCLELQVNILQCLVETNVETN